MGRWRHNLMWCMVLVLQDRGPTSSCLGMRDHLAALLVARMGSAGLRTSRSLALDLLAGTVEWRWSRDFVAFVPRRGRRGTGGVRWCRCFSSSVDEIGDAVEPLVVEVICWAVAQELPRHQQRRLLVYRTAADQRGRRRGR